MTSNPPTPHAPAWDATDTALPALPGLDTSRGLAFFAGDPQVYRRALQHFAELYGGGIAAIEDTIEALATRSVPLSPVRPETLRRALHSVGGACAAVGALALHRQATALEQQLGSALQHERLAPDLVRFAQDLERLVAGLRTHLADAGPIRTVR